MACLDNIIEINKSDCIGNSRETINTNFTVLKDKVCSLETKTIVIEDKAIYFVPLYGVILYYGDITPGGTDFEPNGIGKVSKNLQAFAICNGANGTPDMRDRFVVGAGRNYAQKTYGPQVPGVAPTNFNDTLSLQFSSVRLDVTEMPTHNHGVTEPTSSNGQKGHKHGITQQDHTHDFKLSTKSADNLFQTESGFAQNKSQDGDDCKTQGAQADIEINYATTGITIDDKGGSQKHENRPPYIALGYIMRIL